MISSPWQIYVSFILLDRDTVSSVGIIRGKALPGTNEYNAQICYFRHALALDERRVKFQPEYICGGDSIGHAGPSSSTNTTNARPEQGNPNENIDTDDAVSHEIVVRPRVR